MELMKPKIKINKLVKKFGIFTALDSINVWGTGEEKRDLLQQQ